MQFLVGLAVVDSVRRRGQLPTHVFQVENRPLNTALIVKQRQTHRQKRFAASTHHLDRPQQHVTQLLVQAEHGPHARHVTDRRIHGNQQQWAKRSKHLVAPELPGVAC